MGYSMLKNSGSCKNYVNYNLADSALRFIRERCEGLRFSKEKADKEQLGGMLLGKSLSEGQIPYNMQMDIDRLCFENAISRFLKSGAKSDAFDVYFCYLEMFIGDYNKTRRMIELLSEYEVNGSELLLKHRDHYSHSVYVFVLGLAIYETNEKFRAEYNKFYNITEEHEAACHFLKYWGLTSLFHDIGYPFELPFEQVESYFEDENKKRKECPFVAYNTLEKLISIDKDTEKKVQMIYPDVAFTTTNEIFAYDLAKKMGSVYRFSTETMNSCLSQKATNPDKFGFFMDHAFFSATLLFKKLFVEMNCELKKEHLDALTAILMHNSLYKFNITNYKSEENIPFKAKLHPLAFVLMLCDELQCWDRVAYGKNSKLELHPMDCKFDFSDNSIKAVYCFDKTEEYKIKSFIAKFNEWSKTKSGDAPKLKAYSGMYLKEENGKSSFVNDIERIVDLSDIVFSVDTKLTEKNKSHGYLSQSKFMYLYNFAIILNGRWSCIDEWKEAVKSGNVDRFLTDSAKSVEFAEKFDNLSLEYKLSNINQAKSFAKYLDEIGCFYTHNSVDYDIMEKFTVKETRHIGKLEHQRWLQEHLDMGWTYGEPKDKNERERIRQHKDMVKNLDGNISEITFKTAENNYNRLAKAEQDKDTDPMNCILAMLKLFEGLRIYRLK